MIRHIIYNVFHAHISLPHRGGSGWGFSLPCGGGLVVGLCLLISSCIEPPLHLPAQEVLVEGPVVETELEVVWHVDVDWQKDWYYGWDEDDIKYWKDSIGYTMPTNYEVRRYYQANNPGAPHTNVDPFTIYSTKFRRTYDFGYYDMLLWSNIDSEEHTQVLLIDEDDLDEVHATTTVTHGMNRVVTRSQNDYFNVVAGINAGNSQITGLFNQPEIFYAAYPRDIYISPYIQDYDYYDEVEKCWVKKLNCTLVPRVFIYLVQVILRNNQSGRIKDVAGDNALSNLSAGTSVNDGHTWNLPGVVYFKSRMKHNMDYKGETVDIVGAKLTTFGLCDLPPYEKWTGPEYTGSRTDLRNDLYVGLTFNNGATQTLQIDVTDQVRHQSHGGIITVVIDAKDIPDPPGPDPGSGTLFVPTVEDYDEVIYDIVM